MELPTTFPASAQLTFVFHDLSSTQPNPPLEEVILPRRLWTTLTPVQREQIRQHLITLLQEVLHATDHC